MELFFAAPENVSDDHIILDDFERKHVLQSLRKSSGAEIHVTDGRGTLFRTRLESERPNLTVSILSSEKLKRPKPELMLALGYIRPSRLEFVLEKGTELGVHQFMLIRTQHANYLSENLRRYEKILRQAIKQSQQFYLPQILHFESLDDFIVHSSKANVRISAINRQYPSLFQKISTFDWKESHSFLYIVGPEGGFSKSEVEHLGQSGFEPVSLGNNRLRAETAAISGISLINQYIHQ